MSLENLNGTLVADRYVLQRFLGHGVYGTVYAALDIETEETYAVKLEHLESRSPRLKYEHAMYKRLHQFGEVQGVPKVYQYDETNNFRALVMDRLGANLESGNMVDKLPAGQVMKIGYNAIDIIRRIHSKGILHLDLKPDNLMYGFSAERESSLFIVDFGMAESLVDWRTGRHKTCKKEPDVTGSMAFSSINTHDQVSRSRKDDLESLGYLLICLFNGTLPWESDVISNSTITSFDSQETYSYSDAEDERYDEVGKMKKEITVERLCDGLPHAMHKYFQYVRNLSFSETPKYEYLMSLFQEPSS